MNLPDFNDSDYKQGVLDAVRQLTIDVKNAVLGLQGGKHRSYMVGPSVEFSEHNRYYPGDDLRNIDWNAVARTGQYFVKAHEKEARLTCLLMLDCSASMDYKGSGTAITKLYFAKTILGAIAHVLLRQGDSVGLVAFARKRKAWVPPRSNPGHINKLLEALANATHDGETGTDINNALGFAPDVVGQRGLVVLASDLWGSDEKTELNLAGMAAKKHEVAVFHTLSPDETGLPFDGATYFEGLENEGGIYTKPALIREEYKAAVKREQDKWQRLSARSGITFIDACSSSPPAQLIARLAVQNESRQRR